MKLASTRTRNCAIARLFTLLLTALLAGPASAQVIRSQWDRVRDYETDTDVVNRAMIDSSGNVYVVGRAKEPDPSHGYDVWVVK